MAPADRTARLLEWIQKLGRGAHSWRSVRRVVVAVTGGLVLLTGVLMLVLPGPALVVIPTGLAILALEFRWAARLLAELRRRIEETGSRITGGDSRSRPPTPCPGPGREPPDPRS